MLNTTEVKIDGQINEPSALFRWGILIFVSLAMFGNYYVYDSISPLADLLSKRLNFTDSDIGLLNGIYSLPNLFMVLIGGIIIDKIGTKISTFIFALICFAGALITAYSGGILEVMAAGRLVFGLGAESLIVAVTTVLGRWFKGKKLSFAFGINLTIARLGSFAALNSPFWAKDVYQDWQGPLLIAAVMGFVSVIAAVAYWVMDGHADKKYSIGKVDEQDEIKISNIFIVDTRRIIVAALIIVLSIIFVPGNLMFVTSLATILLFVKFSFGKSYVYIVLLCVTFYSAIFPFQTFAVKFFMQEHFAQVPEDFARQMGGFLSSILILFSMILTPIFGLMADKYGKRASLMFIGSLMLIPVYLIMVYVKVDGVIPPEVLQMANSGSDTDSGIVGAVINFFEYFGIMFHTLFNYFPNLLIPMAVMGISFSLIPAVMWPSVALIVKESNLGTAFGLMTMIQAVGLSGFNFLIGWANDYSGGYTMGMWIFSSLGFFGLLFSYLLKKNEMGPNGHQLEEGSS